jgi:DNA polymerase elongation subunit (family B)
LFKNIYYDSYKNKIHLWEIVDGKHKYETFDHEIEYYVEDKTRKSQITDIYGTPVVKKIAESTKSLRELRKMTKLYESDVSEEVKFLQKRYGTSEERVDPTQYNVCVIDIEVASGCKFSKSHEIKIRKDNKTELVFLADFELCQTQDYEVWDEEIKKWTSFQKSCYFETSEFPKPELAKYPINLITLNFVNKGKIYTFGSDPYTGNSPLVQNYYHDKNEKQLLEKFIQFWRRSKVDIAVAYNAPFDFGYILKRCENLGIDPNLLSPVGRVEYKNPKRIRIHGITILDYIDLYKKFSFTPQPSYKLENVAMAEIKEGKTKYEGNIFTIWQTDWNLFVEYNIQDTILVEKMDKKRKFVNLAIKLAVESIVPIDRCMTTTAIVEGYILKTIHKQNQVMSDRVREDVWEKDSDDDDDELEGAYVEAHPGFYNWLMSFDVESLYPHMIMMYNISPETKLSFEDIKNMDPSEYITTPVEGIYYKKNVKGILPMITETIFKERKMYKGLMKDAFEQHNDVDHEYYDGMQHNRKILINCFHPNTQILTERGIRYVKDVKIGDLVWSINTNTKQAELKPIKDTVDRLNTDDSLVVFNNTDVLLRVTKEHDMLVEQNGEIVRIKAKELIGKEYTVVVDNDEIGFRTIFKSNEIYEEEYYGRVYCVHVEDNHTVLVGESQRMVWTGNCLYGVLGSDAFHYYDIDNASVVTAGGRELIKFLSSNANDYLKNFLPSRIGKFYNDSVVDSKKVPKNSVCVIDTDSVTGDSIINTSIGDITISSLFDMFKNTALEKSEDNFVSPITNVKSLCYDGYKIKNNNITYIKKHKVVKKMFKIRVGDDSVIVTEDHSIMIIRNNKMLSVKVKDMIPGDKIIWNH